jgi:hypothetical protein
VQTIEATPEQTTLGGRATRSLTALVSLGPQGTTRALAAAWLVTRAILMVGVAVAHQYCDPEFYQYAGLLAVGKLPYRDYTVEYPPVAVVLLLLPAIPLLPFARIAPRPDPAFAPGFTHLPTPDPTRWGAYGFSFACEMLMLDLLTLWLVRHAARRFVASDPQGLVSGLLYVLLVFLSGALLQKFDLVLGTLCLLAVVALAERRPRVAWTALALATLVKGFPLLAVPIFAGVSLEHARLRRMVAAVRERARPVVEGLATFGIAIAGSTLVVVALAGWRPVWDTITYHTQRGVEIESLYANVMLALGWLPGMRTWSVFSPLDLSRVVRGPLARFASPSSIMLLLVLIALTYVAAWRAHGRVQAAERPIASVVQPMLAATAAALLAFQLSFLALPAHYLLVLLPLAALIRLPNQRLQMVFIASVASVAIFGQVLVVNGVWTALRLLAPGPVVLLSLRNMAWVIAYATLIVALCQWPRTAIANPTLE